MRIEIQDARKVPWWKKLHWQIFVAMALGILVGRIGGEAVVPYVGWLGTLFIKLLRMIIVPLVLTSIISGVASLGGGRDLGRLFGKTLGYYVATSALAAITGLLLVNLIRPGDAFDQERATSKELPDLQTAGSPIELLLDIVPQNFVDAMAKADMLGIIFFCIVFGIAIAGLPAKHRDPLTTLINAAFHAMMRLTGGIIMVAPIGVFGLITRVVGETGFESFAALGLYMVTIASGLTIHLFITLPLLLLLVGRMRPSFHFRNMTEPLAMAFSTSSSGATLPVTLRRWRRRSRCRTRCRRSCCPWARRSTWTAPRSTNVPACSSSPRSGRRLWARAADRRRHHRAAGVHRRRRRAVGRPGDHLPGARSRGPTRAPGGRHRRHACSPSTGRSTCSAPR